MIVQFSSNGFHRLSLLVAASIVFHLSITSFSSLLVRTERSSRCHRGPPTPTKRPCISECRASGVSACQRPEKAHVRLCERREETLPELPTWTLSVSNQNIPTEICPRHSLTCQRHSTVAGLLEIGQCMWCNVVLCACCVAYVVLCLCCMLDVVKNRVCVCVRGCMFVSCVCVYVCVCVCCECCVCSKKAVASRSSTFSVEEYAASSLESVLTGLANRSMASRMSSETAMLFLFSRQTRTTGLASWPKCSRNPRSLLEPCMHTSHMPLDLQEES